MSSHTLGGASGKAGVEANSDGRQQSPDPLAALNVDKFSKARGSRKGLDEPSRVDKGQRLHLLLPLTSCANTTNDLTSLSLRSLTCDMALIARVPRTTK